MYLMLAAGLGLAFLAYLIYTLFVKVLFFYVKVARAYGWEGTYLIYTPLKGLYGHWNARGLRLHGDAYHFYK
jgi:cytochrome P450